MTITNGEITVPNSDITIGAVYTTSSGLSEFDITLTTVTGLNVTLNMNGTKNWGDGTTDTSTSHTYSTTGDYTITCDGTTMNTSTSNGLFGQTSGNDCYCLTSARLANVTDISNGAFAYCFSLMSITIPKGVTSIGERAFTNYCAIRSIVLPSTVTSIGIASFYYTENLKAMALPSGITTIDNTALQTIKCLESITLPQSISSINNGLISQNRVICHITIPYGVTSIGSHAFQNNTSIIEYDFSNCTSIPTLSNTNAFLSINALCKIKVPASLESAWKTETNWSTYANYIVGV